MIPLPTVPLFLEDQCPCDLGRSLGTTMRAPALLSLLSCLMVPGGARILGRCAVARKLHEGGLDYFEGYSLANCECPAPAPAWVPARGLPGRPHASFLLGVCLAYFESKFNPSAVYENTPGGATGYGLFQIRDTKWCKPGGNLCHVPCSGRGTFTHAGALGCSLPVAGAHGFEAARGGHVQGSSQCRAGLGRQRPPSRGAEQGSGYAEALQALSPSEHGEQRSVRGLPGLLPTGTDAATLSGRGGGWSTDSCHPEGACPPLLDAWRLQRVQALPGFPLCKPLRRLTADLAPSLWCLLSARCVPEPFTRSPLIVTV